jgi:hypothetical protein
MITPINHSYSLTSYYNFCFSHASYNWIMKWDAEFRPSRELIAYINSDLAIKSKRPTRIKIKCLFGSSKRLHFEPYLTNALAGFDRYIFWEVPTYTAKYKEVILDDSMSIKTLSRNVIKDYWDQPTWFLNKKTYDKDLATKYTDAVRILGIEPKGMARAGSKEGDTIFFLVRKNKDKLEAKGIKLDFKS